MIGSTRSPRIRAMSILLALIGGYVLVFTPLACAPTGQERYEHRLANTGLPALHAVQSDRLREIMNKLQYDPMPDIEYANAELERQRRSREITEVAGAMAAAADKMPDAIKEINLPEKDRAVFVSLAGKLHREAMSVSEAGHKQEFEEVRRSLERMQATCNACHSLFRGPSARP